jgi:cell division protein FtsQ
MMEDNDTIVPVQRESKKREIAGLVILFLTLIVISAGAYGWHKELTVETIAVEGNRIVSVPEILALTNIRVGATLSSVKLTAIRERILKNAFINDATVRRDLPGAIVISVHERTPVAFINIGELVSCDENGIVMPHIVSPEILNLPVITGIQNTDRIQPGMVLENTDARDALTMLLYFAEIDPAMFQMISEVRPVNEGELMIYTTDFAVPVMIGRGRMTEKIALLSSFWKEVVRSGTAGRFESIDVRFQDQVIVRWAGNARTSTQPG